MVRAARHELEAAGIEQTIEHVLADGGYWNNRQMTALADGGYWNSAQMTALAAERIETIIPPSSSGDRPRRAKPRQGPHAERIAAGLATEDGARRYRRRQQIVEPVFAHIKHLRAITRFSRRGRGAVQAEWQLIAATHNLLKRFRRPLATA